MWKMMCEIVIMMSLLIDMSIVCVWHNFKDLVKRFYNDTSLVHVLIYEFSIESYLVALITIKSQIEKGKTCGERCRKSYFRGFTLTKIVDGLTLYVVAWVRELFHHHKYITHQSLILIHVLLGWLSLIYEYWYVLRLLIWMTYMC